MFGLESVRFGNYCYRIAFDTRVPCLFMIVLFSFIYFRLYSNLGICEFGVQTVRTFKSENIAVKYAQ